MTGQQLQKYRRKKHVRQDDPLLLTMLGLSNVLELAPIELGRIPITDAFAKEFIQACNILARPSWAPRPGRPRKVKSEEVAA